MLLAIETATDVCSVALVADASTVASAEVLRPKAHAEHLVPLVADLLRREGAGAAALTAVAVSAGPGSYTGLRIGVSTAKGLCFSGGAALVAVPSLEALASSVEEFMGMEDLAVPCFGSRRDEVYVAAYRRGADGLVEVTPPTAVHLDHISDWLTDCAGQLWVLGEAGSRVGARLDLPHRVLDPRAHRPRAETVAQLALRRLSAGTVEDVAAFEPFYLKPFEAKRAASIFDRLPH